MVDGLQAEREQGITIDVAYRYFSKTQRNFISMSGVVREPPIGCIELPISGCKPKNLTLARFDSVAPENGTSPHKRH